MRLLSQAIRHYLLSLARALRQRIHRDDSESGDDWDVPPDDSAFACCAAMFRRAAGPLDGIHPDLAGLLAHNRDRDIRLNDRLTELSDLASHWRAQAEALEAAFGDVLPQLEAMERRAASAEAEAHVYRRAVLGLQTRYVGYCASALHRLDDRPVETDEQPAGPDDTHSVRLSARPGHRLRLVG